MEKKEQTELVKEQTVLIVDDEIQIGRVIASLLKNIAVASVYASNGLEALETLKSSPKPFALIIADQRMPGMSGTEFFERASDIAPNSIRFMITGYADVRSMIDAVNRGSIHKYAIKPWDNEDFLASVKEGLEQYELAEENIRLFRLAKQQNTKLVELNRMLNESAAKQAKILEALDIRISAEGCRRTDTEQDILIQESGWAGETANASDAGLKEIKLQLIQNGLLDYEKINSFYCDLLHELAHRFQKR